MNSNPAAEVSRVGRAAFYLGVASLASLFLSVLAGIVFDSLGVVTLFRSVVIPLSITALLFGLIGRQKADSIGFHGQQQARIGLLLGLISLIAAMLTIIIVAVFFTLFLL